MKVEVVSNPEKHCVVIRDDKGKIVDVIWTKTKYRALQIAEDMDRNKD